MKLICIDVKTCCKSNVGGEELRKNEGEKGCEV
jgi:hypothetical protein